MKTVFLVSYDVADAKRLTKPGQWGVTATAASDLINAHLAFMLGRQNGAQLYNAQGRPQFDTPAEIAGVRQYVDLMAVVAVCGGFPVRIS